MSSDTMSDHSVKPVVTHVCANGGAKVTYDQNPMIVGNTHDPVALVTLCHGLGDSAHGWADAAHFFAQQLPKALFMLPTAPMQPVTVNMNMRCNAWYDITSLGSSSRIIQDGEGVLTSARYVSAMAGHIAHKHKIPTSRIVFGGFSQGAAISIAAGLTAPYVAAGVMAMSGYLAADTGIAKVLNKAVPSATPFLICHGRQDPVVGFKLAEMSRDNLLRDPFIVNSIEFKEYNMEHSTCMPEMRDIVQWLKKTVPGL